MPPATILGWFDRGNTGDEAYRLAFPRVLGAAANFVTSLGAAPPGGPLVLGGGDVVYPAFTRRFDGLPRPAVASVTLTAASDFAFLRDCPRVVVRDRRSLALALANGVPHAEYAPDFAFALEPDAGRGRRWAEGWFAAEGLELYEKLVVVAPSSYLLHGGPDSLARDLTAALWVSQGVARVADESNASFLFLPFSTNPPHDDRYAAGLLAGRCKWWKKNLAVFDRLDVQATLDVVAAADCVVSSRYHASVFATLAGVPFVDVTHHDKNLGLLEDAGVAHWSVPFWSFDPGRFAGLLRGHLAAGRGNETLTAFATNARRVLGGLSLP